MNAEPQTEAQLALGQMLFEAGDGAQAWEAFATVARKGDARALNMLGRLAEQGWSGRAPDPALAVRQYRKAAQAGSAWALFNLADLCLNGRGVPEDAAQAVALYQQAAEKGVTQALNMLGLCYEEGRGVEADPLTALRFFRAGAKAGDCWASYNLGRHALAANDAATALKWFRYSMDRGFAGFWRVLSMALLEQDDPGLCALGAEAATRAGKGEAALNRRKEATR